MVVSTHLMLTRHAMKENVDPLPSHIRKEVKRVGEEALKRTQPAKKEKIEKAPPSLEKTFCLLKTKRNLVEKYATQGKNKLFQKNKLKMVELEKSLLSALAVSVPFSLEQEIASANPKHVAFNPTYENPLRNLQNARSLISSLYTKRPDLQALSQLKGILELLAYLIAAKMGEDYDPTTSEFFKKFCGGYQFSLKQFIQMEKVFFYFIDYEGCNFDFADNKPPIQDWIDRIKCGALSENCSFEQFLLSDSYGSLERVLKEYNSSTDFAVKMTASLSCQNHFETYTQAKERYEKSTEHMFADLSGAISIRRIPQQDRVCTFVLSASIPISLIFPEIPFETEPLEELFPEILKMSWLP